MKAHPSRTILVVDDSESVRHFVKKTLENAGFSVHTLDSALVLLREARNASPDLILLDINMPAISGHRALQIARQHGFLRSTRVVFFSDRPEEELHEFVQTSGADGFIPKTADAHELIRRVQQHLPS